MTVCIVGSILEKDGKTIKLRDRRTNEDFSCLLETDDVLDLKVGDTGIFVGTWYNGRATVKKIELRKFLDPLYEKDLYELSSKFTLIPVIKDPFTEVYLQFKEKADEQLRQESESSDDSPQTT